MCSLCVSAGELALDHFTWNHIRILLNRAWKFHSSAHIGNWILASGWVFNMFSEHILSGKLLFCLATQPNNKRTPGLDEILLGPVQMKVQESNDQ